MLLAGLSVVYAECNDNPQGGIPSSDCLENPLGDTETFQQLLDKIVNVVTTLGGIVAVLFIIWSGFLFVTARGNEEQLKTARTTFYWTIIGTAILFGAGIISEAIVNFFI